MHITPFFVLNNPIASVFEETAQNSFNLQITFGKLAHSAHFSLTGKAGQIQIYRQSEHIPHKIEMGQIN